MVSTTVAQTSRLIALGSASARNLLKRDPWCAAGIGYNTYAADGTCHALTGVLETNEDYTLEIAVSGYKSAGHQCTMPKGVPALR